MGVELGRVGGVKDELERGSARKTLTRVGSERNGG